MNLKKGKENFYGLFRESPKRSSPRVSRRAAPSTAAVLKTLQKPSPGGWVRRAEGHEYLPSTFCPVCLSHNSED